MVQLQRYPDNPILVPNQNNQWEADGAFNGSVVLGRDNRYHMVFRALSKNQRQNGVDMRVSSIGYAQSQDGLHFGEHKQILKPDEDWEIYGVEDPRITLINDTYYICYTALSVYPFSAYGIKLAVAKTKDFQTFEKHPVTTFNSKAMAIFPEKIHDKMAAILTLNTDLPPAKIAVAYFDREEDMWSPYFWDEWYQNANSHIIHLLRDMRDQVELGSTPIKTKYGWLVLYSYIKDYMSNEKKFGIEAMLLDPNHPRHVIGRTEYSLISPQAEYELRGDVPNVIFPSGAMVKGDELFVYYGAADTRVAVASCKLDDVLHDIFPKAQTPVTAEATDKQFVRFEGNPILTPTIEWNWQAKAVFNPSAIYAHGEVYLIYRAQSLDGESVFGLAISRDGLHIDINFDYPIYVPRAPFEKKPHREGNSGCEDPRIAEMDDRFYMLYTAYDGVHPPRVAQTSISVEDFIRRQWNWREPILISQENVDDKDACVVKGKDGKYNVFHRINGEIWIDVSYKMDFSEKKPLAGKIIAKARRDKWDNVKIGIAAPPIETDRGWLLLYHGVSEPGFMYKVGAMLLDLADPSQVIARTDEPVFEPKMPYEIEGQVPNVVFPCGAVVIDGMIYMYYGGADTVVGVATMPLNVLLDLLKKK